MSFRLWHYVVRIVAPAFILAVLAYFFAPNNSTVAAIAMASWVVVMALGLLGGAMGFFRSRGTLRMTCPCCGRKGSLVPLLGGMGLDCPACGLVYESGFMKLRLERKVPDSETGTAERPLEDVPQALREELSLLPRGGTYFCRWRTLRWFLPMLLPPATGLGAACWRGKIVVGGILFVLSAVCGVIAFVFLCSGVSSSNRGTFTRAREPIRFWLDVAIAGTLYLALALGGWIIQ